MYKEIDITEAQVYVGTYRKYNEGSIFGEWLQLSDHNSREEFYNACRELHNDEEDPEFMFQDYENIPDGLISESWMSPKLFEVIQELENMSSEIQQAFLIWCSNNHSNFSDKEITDLITEFENDFIGEYDSEEDFARELIENRSDLNDFALQYFDYESYARDLFLGDYWYCDGYVFVNN